MLVKKQEPTQKQRAPKQEKKISEKDMSINALCIMYIKMDWVHAKYTYKLSAQVMRKLIMRYRGATKWGLEWCEKNASTIKIEGCSFAEMVQHFKLARWERWVRSYCQTDKEKADRWIKDYKLKPIKEILIVEKAKGLLVRGPITEFQRKVRYFKDGGKTARETEGLSLEQVKEERRIKRLAERACAYFKDSTIGDKYP